MNNISYAKAYTQVLVLLKQLPENEYSKIPKSEIEYLEKHKDENYSFKIDYSKALEEQEISIIANSAIVRFFRDYFATENQKAKLESILKSNLRKVEEEKGKSYNADEIFKNKTLSNNMPTNEITAMIEHKKTNFFITILNRIIKMFKK